MEKKAYNKPELTVVKLTSMTHLLTVSDPMEDDGGEYAGDGPSSSNNSRRASFSTFDGEE